MNDLLMSGDLSERLSVSSMPGAIATFAFGKAKLATNFVSIEKEEEGMLILATIDEQDFPFKYFGLYADKVIINSGSEILTFVGKFDILKIEKTNNYLLKFGAKTYERTIWNESNTDS
tara:strand:- start:3151 stop:3504 length:354 start_codon:yes stop_codon:yes gene_type:complete